MYTAKPTRQEFTYKFHRMVRIHHPSLQNQHGRLRQKIDYLQREIIINQIITMYGIHIDNEHNSEKSDHESLSDFLENVTTHDTILSAVSYELTLCSCVVCIRMV